MEFHKDAIRSESPDPVILMTATVSPNGMSLTKLQDAETRKAQYLHAIEHYLEHTKCKIVFCENTGTDIYDEIKSLEKFERLEYLTFNQNYRKDLGKGYGEALIIKYALNNSEFLKHAEYVIKITGRVIIENVDELLNLTPTSRNILAVEYSSIIFAVSVCFMAPKYTLLKCATDQIRICEKNNIDELIEKTLSDTFINSSDLRITEFFPQINGISGTSGYPYINEPIFQRKLNHYGVLVLVYKIKKDFFRRIVAYIKWIYWIIYRKIYILFSH